MILLVLAHRGEAQSFLKNLNLKAHQIQNFYTNDELSLLITGEGPLESLSKVSYILGTSQFTQVINFGIAGSLDPKYETGSIYNIRTAYAHDSSSPLFHSYQLAKNSKVDCISTFERVLSDDFAQVLGHFSHIVDRELWGIAKACSIQKIPLTSYKLISDQAGNQTNCFDLKHKAQEFSDRLFEHYLSLDISLNKNISSTDLALDLPFHASFTQRKKILKLTQKINSQKLIDRILTQVKNPQEFIRELEFYINPIDKSLYEQINKIEMPFKAIGAQLLFKNNFEKKEFTLQMNVNSSKNIVNLIEVLNNFEFEEIEKIWNGEINV